MPDDFACDPPLFSGNSEIMIPIGSARRAASYTRHQRRDTMRGVVRSGSGNGCRAVSACKKVAYNQLSRAGEITCAPPLLRVMPPYSAAVLSDKEAADIFAFLKTLPGRRPAKDIPILNN
jgi:hypothetical protein